jgi:hypothetical protein
MAEFEMTTAELTSSEEPEMMLKMLASATPTKNDDGDDGMHRA